MKTWEKKIRNTSKRLYRSGLSKAGAGDLSRAADDLEKAIRYDKLNEEARNLLGLILYQKGELGEAVKQWSISEYLNSENNRASEYLHEIKQDPKLFNRMNESLHLYNEALLLAKKGSTDFAITRLKKSVHQSPQLVKAQLLLAICYIETGQYKTALRVLDQVAKVEPLNPEAMRYRLYIAQQRQEGTQDAVVSDIQDLSRDLYVQQALPEPDKEEIFRERRRRKKAVRNISEPLMQVLLFFAGVLCCLGFMQTLWYPNEIRDLKSQVQELMISQDQLRQEKEVLQIKVETAADVMKEISESGFEMQASVLADVDEILREWGEKNDEP